MGHADKLKKKPQAPITTGPLKKKLRTLITSGPTYEGVARELDVAKSTVHGWASDKMAATPPAAQLLALARVLGVTVDYLLDDALDEPPRAPSDEERALLQIVLQFIERGKTGEAIARLVRIGGAGGEKEAPAPAPTHLGHRIIPTVIHTVGRGVEAGAAKAKAKDDAGSAKKNNGGRQPG